MASASDGERVTATTTVRELSSFLREIPSQLRPVVGLAALLFGGALAWLVVAGDHTTGVVVWAPSTALLAVAVLLVLLLFAQLLRAELSKSRVLLREEVARTTARLLDERGRMWPAAGVLLGCHFGRRRISCGALDVHGFESAQLPPARSYGRLVPPVSRHVDPSANAEARFALAAQVIAEAARRARDARPELRIEGIGVGVPGFVRLADKKLVVAATPGMPDATNVVDEIVRRLPDDPALLTMFGSDQRSDIAERFWLDNDVRCAARSLLAQHLDDPGWADFVCLHVGTGVGASIVLHHELHYGHLGWAGEIGHIDLSAGSGLQLRLGGGASLAPLRCACGAEGFHYESLLNYEGLRTMAELVEGRLFTDFDTAFTHPSGDAWSADDLARIGWPRLVGSGGRDSSLPPHVRELAGSQPGGAYLDTVLSAYVAMLAAGLSTLVNVLDVEKVVLLGSLVEGLHPNRDFDVRLQRAMAARLRRPDVERDYGRVDEDAWQGAALLCRDRGYHRARRRQPPAEEHLVELTHIPPNGHSAPLAAAGARR